MSHVLFADYFCLDPGAKETDLFSVIAVLSTALCNRSIPDVNTLSRAWIGIKLHSSTYIRHASTGTGNQKSRVVSLDFS